MTRLQRLLKPLDVFLRVETASGLALLAAATAAHVWANSSLHEGYERAWDAPVHLIGVTIRYLINEGLMAVFFLVVGLEIRREMHDGTLSSPALAALPLVAAAGGIVAPAIIYLALAPAAASEGWAVATATDIAFAVGVLALLGPRVDAALRILLLAIAIADDIAAVLIIAFFYAEGVAPAGLAVAAGGVAIGWLLHRARANIWLACLLPGAIVWYGFHAAGLHPALAGVVVGLATPMKPSPQAGGEPPASKLESALHPWVAFGVMPLFALANAGVRLGGIDLSNDATPWVAGAVALGLLAGKPLGIVAAVALAVRTRFFSLPDGVTATGVAIVGCLGGIGFTMSIFVAGLAFPEPALLALAKLGVLAGSAGAALAGLLLGWLLLPRRGG